VPRTQTFCENRSRLNDGRQNGSKGSASKEPFSASSLNPIAPNIAKKSPWTSPVEWLLRLISRRFLHAAVGSNDFSIELGIVAHLPQPLRDLLV
jgi:hypothetical protein